MNKAHTDHPPPQKKIKKIKMKIQNNNYWYDDY